MTPDTKIAEELRDARANRHLYHAEVDQLNRLLDRAAARIEALEADKKALMSMFSAVVVPLEVIVASDTEQEIREISPVLRTHLREAVAKCRDTANLIARRDLDAKGGG